MHNVYMLGYKSKNNTARQTPAHIFYYSTAMFFMLSRLINKTFILITVQPFRFPDLQALFAGSTWDFAPSFRWLWVGLEGDGIDAWG